MALSNSNSRQGKNNEAKTKRFYITLLAFLLVALFASWFIRAMFSPNASWRDVEFDTALSRFDYNIMLARVEWMRQGQPSDVYLSLAEWDANGNASIEANGTVRVLMSRTGWPMARSKGVNGCVELWHLLGQAGQLKRELKVEYDATGQAPLCKFYYGGIEGFHYYPNSGKVDKLY